MLRFVFHRHYVRDEGGRTEVLHAGESRACSGFTQYRLQRRHNGCDPALPRHRQADGGLQEIDAEGLQERCQCLGKRHAMPARHRPDSDRIGAIGRQAVKDLARCQLLAAAAKNAPPCNMVSICRSREPASASASSAISCRSSPSWHTASFPHKARRHSSRNHASPAIAASPEGLPHPRPDRHAPPAPARDYS